MFPYIPVMVDSYMGFFEHSVSLKPVVNHHYPY